MAIHKSRQLSLEYTSYQYEASTRHARLGWGRCHTILKLSDIALLVLLVFLPGIYYDPSGTSEFCCLVVGQYQYAGFNNNMGDANH